MRCQYWIPLNYTTIDEVPPERNTDICLKIRESLKHRFMEYRLERYPGCGVIWLHGGDFTKELLKSFPKDMIKEPDQDKIY